MCGGFIGGWGGAAVLSFKEGGGVRLGEGAAEVGGQVADGVYIIFYGYGGGA